MIMLIMCRRFDLPIMFLFIFVAKLTIYTQINKQIVIFLMIKASNLKIFAVLSVIQSYTHMYFLSSKAHSL